MPINRTAVLAAVDAALVQVKAIETEYASVMPTLSLVPLTACSRARDALNAVADEFRGGGYHNTY